MNYQTKKLRGCLLIMACTFLVPGAHAAERPNIVFILADDMGWNQPGFNGGNPALTPNIDQLASEGMRLNDFYTHSVCAPTRAAFLTGRYAFRTWSDWRSEDFGKPSYLAKLGLELAVNERDASGSILPPISNACSCSLV